MTGIKSDTNESSLPVLKYHRVLIGLTVFEYIEVNYMVDN